VDSVLVFFKDRNPVAVNSPSRRNKSSSAKWFARQRGDPFLKQRDELQFRARSAFKLMEIQERYRFLPNVKERSKGAPLDPEDIVIVDLGAAPGGWSQAAARLLGRDWEDVAFEGWGASPSRQTINAPLFPSICYQSNLYQGVTLFKETSSTRLLGNRLKQRYAPEKSQRLMFCFRTWHHLRQASTRQIQKVSSS
jgi:hypothetical protein